MTATVLQCDREALKPCPFCGAAGKIIAPLGSGNIRAGNCSADNCRASGPWGKDEAAAIAAWNTRHDSTREMVEALEKCRAQFEFYVQSHLAKQPPDMDKAATNQSFVEMLDTILAHEGTDR